jgi:hypothetical protein
MRQILLDFGSPCKFCGCGLSGLKKPELYLSREVSQADEASSAAVRLVYVCLFHFSGEPLLSVFPRECLRLTPRHLRLVRAGEGGQTQLDQGATPITRRPRPLSFIQGSTLQVFASGISEETRVSVSLGRKITDKAVFDRLARAG